MALNWEGREQMIRLCFFGNCEFFSFLLLCTHLYTWCVEYVPRPRQIISSQFRENKNISASLRARWSVCVNCVDVSSTQTWLTMRFLISLRDVWDVLKGSRTSEVQRNLTKTKTRRWKKIDRLFGFTQCVNDSFAFKACIVYFVDHHCYW